MQTRPQPLWITVLRPPLLALAFIFKTVDRLCFAWWLDPWLQRRKNKSLSDDVQANLYFLYSEGRLVKEKHLRILPFDYATVRIIFENIVFCFTRGRGELNVSLSPRHAPKDTHILQVVIATLDSKDVTEQSEVSYLSEVADLLRPRLDALNQAFSEQAYPDFQKRFAFVEQTLRVLTRQAEWELNRKLYPFR